MNDGKRPKLRPLAFALQKRMCVVWFDEFSPRIGDSLRGQIERGLRECSKCIIILTRHFLGNEIETNQFLQPGDSQPKWENIQPLDLHTPKRREQLYHAALAAGVIPSTEAHRRTFFAAIAHATRAAKSNTCGLLRQLIETPAYYRFISQADEDQASLWLSEQQPHLNLDSLLPNEPTDDSDDHRIVSYLCNRLRKAGFPTNNCFALVMTTHEGKKQLPGWTQDRWDTAVVALQEQGTADRWRA